MLRTILATLALTALTACSQGEPPFEIETYDRDNQIFGVEYVEVNVIARTDGVEVQDIIVNRGNCKLEKIAEKLGGRTVPKTLNFGQSASFTFGGPCSASEVTVVTDMGDWTWEY
ncbi:MAG: hypothetical protein P1U64_11835 [Alcanivoracaceae bacterium]|nr:hypothetical protein [Alcanivoracaceae bacterium]